MVRVRKLPGVAAAAAVVWLTLSVAGPGRAEERAEEPAGDKVRRVRKDFEGQLIGVAKDLQEKIGFDRKLKDSRLRLGKVTSGIPDSNAELEIERRLRDLFADTLEDDASMILAGEYNFVEGQERDNRGLSVVELILKVVNRRGVVMQSARREVNHSDDIAMLSGVTAVVPDVETLDERNIAVTQAFDEPGFGLRNGTEIHAVGESRYTVEICRLENDGGGCRPLRPESSAGMAFVPLSVRDNFAIRMRNYDPDRSILGEIKIDGLSVVNAFSEDRPYPGYLIAPAPGEDQPAEHRVDGWLRTVADAVDNVFRFEVKTFGRGAASELKSRTGTGVITVQFYAAAEAGERLRGRNFGEVGRGEPVSVDYRTQKVVRSEIAESTVTIRYRPSDAGPADVRR